MIILISISGDTEIYKKCSEIIQEYWTPTNISTLWVSLYHHLLKVEIPQLKNYDEVLAQLSRVLNAGIGITEVTEEKFTELVIAL